MSNPTAPSSRRKRILVAEDDASISSILVRVLSKDYEVVTANTGPAALELARAEPRPDLLILDVMMPGMDGYAVASTVRTLPGLKQVPIFFLTAKSGPLDIIQGIQHGARHYIPKPFKIDDLMAKVRKALG